MDGSGTLRWFQYHSKSFEFCALATFKASTHCELYPIKIATTFSESKTGLIAKVFLVTNFHYNYGTTKQNSLQTVSMLM